LNLHNNIVHQHAPLCVVEPKTPLNVANEILREKRKELNWI